ncbi:Docking protein 6 [Pteropus alecto]|uniref:Docking protein 6 n=1 Tax=Pteropus alecto TaxID=9402 RepID=L5KHR2_PTEAL|nr:Docking protein 6 [Pteropus alecto]
MIYQKVHSATLAIAEQHERVMLEMEQKARLQTSLTEPMTLSKSVSLPRSAYWHHITRQNSVGEIYSLQGKGEPANAGGRRRENSKEGPWNRTDELGSLRRRVGTSFTVSLIQILPSHAMKSLPCECHDASPFPGVLTDSLSSMEVKHTQSHLVSARTGLSVCDHNPFPVLLVFREISTGHGFGASKMSRAQTFPSYAAEQSAETPQSLSRSGSYGFSYSSSLIQ